MTAVISERDQDCGSSLQATERVKSYLQTAPKVRKIRFKYSATPEGLANADINLRAAAIESYLDLDL